VLEIMSGGGTVLIVDFLIIGDLGILVIGVDGRLDFIIIIM
jgi:hypothetical protein